MSVRAFEVVPVIEKLVEGKSKTKITTVECFGDSLYVGTTDGFLVYYELDQGTTATGKLTCSTTLKAQQHTGSSKPITKILLAPDEQKLLVLVDSKLITLHAKSLKPIEGSKVVKGHGIICRDFSQDGSPTCHFSVTKKAKIPGNFGGLGGLGGSLVGGIYHYAFDKSTGVLGADQRMRDNEGGNFTDCVALARDGRSVCFARKGMYKVVNLMTQEVTELFPYDDRHTIPMVTRVGSREFLLNVWTEGVTTGMFVSSTGSISRAPIQWPFGPTAIAVNYPYIVALNQEQGMVTVHSILDQQSKQVLVYPDGLILNDTSQRIFIATHNKISLIANLSFETQIDELLLAGRVTEALELAQVTFTPDGALDAAELNKQQQAMQRIQRRAGLAYLHAGQFGDGLDLLAATDTDPREVIAMYPGLLPASSSYTPGLVPQTTEAAASIAAVTSSDASSAKAAKKALVNFLNVIRSDNVTSEWRSDIDTVLARLYAELDGSMLLELVSMDEHASNSVNVDEVLEVLVANNRHHALALLQWGKAGSPRKALEIWRGLTTKKLFDDAYPGLEFAIKALSGISDVDLVYMHAEWMLNADQTASRIFTQRSNTAEPAGFLNPDDVFAFLRPYAEASLNYLEYLVFDVQNLSEAYHTRLALLYLERVKVAMIAYENKRHGGGGGGEDIDDVPALEIAMVTARSKLKIMLQTSSSYRVEMLLAEIQRTNLHQECAVLYGKLGQHEQALKLLVNQLGDFAGAEEYCVQMSQSESSTREGRQEVFLTLLRVYLVRGSGHSQQAIDLLNSPQTDLDPSKVLQMVPPEWGIGVLHAFLRRSVRQKMHLQRTSRITYGLAKQEHLQARAELLRLKGWGVVVNDDTQCEGAACIGKKTGTCSSFEGGGAVCINTETRQVAHKRCIKDEFRSAFPKASEKRPPTLLTYA